MEAKDTVLSREQIAKLPLPHDPYLGEYICRGFASDCCDVMLQAQAEVAFKAGYKKGYGVGKKDGKASGYLDGFLEGTRAGMRDVVEWLRNCRLIDEGQSSIGHPTHSSFLAGCPYCEWQAKLKEWGISED